MKKTMIILVLLLALFLSSCTNDREVNDKQTTETSENTQENNEKENSNNEGNDNKANYSNEDNQVNNTTEDSQQQEKDRVEVEFNLDFALSDGKGNMIQLSDYKGQLVFLNFFTTWCIYCMQEMPEFQKITNEYDDLVEFVIVNVQTDPNEVSVEEVLKWYEEEGYTFPLVFDEEVNETKMFYPYIQGYPTTFVFDEEGTFLGSIPGAMNEDMIIQIIEEYGPKN